MSVVENHPLLPRARPIVIGVCHYCAGRGEIPTDDECSGVETCYRCEGTGNADEMRLRAAYDCGRDDALAQVRLLLRELHEMTGIALETLENSPPAPHYRQLRERIGG